MISGASRASALKLAAMLCVISGILLGVVSLAGLLYFGPAVLQGSTQASSSVATEGNLLLAIIYGIGRTLALVSGIADGIFKAFAALSVLGLIFAALLVQTGRGLRAGKRWAKIAGLVLLPLLAMVAFAAATVFGLA